MPVHDKLNITHENIFLFKPYMVDYVIIIGILEVWGTERLSFDLRKAMPVEQVMDHMDQVNQEELVMDQGEQGQEQVSQEQDQTSRSYPIGMLSL